MLEAHDVIRLLNLTPHPDEGGFFRETYRSAESTAIYYLLTPETFSAMHRLPGDELFHFYLGDPVEMLQLHPDGSGSLHILGQDVAQGMQPQILVPGGVWQGSRLTAGGKFALMGTTMAPPFSFDEYESASRSTLLKSHPAWEGAILTRTV